MCTQFRFWPSKVKILRKPLSISKPERRSQHHFQGRQSRRQKWHDLIEWHRIAGRLPVLPSLKRRARDADKRGNTEREPDNERRETTPEIHSLVPSAILRPLGDARECRSVSTLLLISCCDGSDPMFLLRIPAETHSYFSGGGWWADAARFSTAVSPSQENAESVPLIVLRGMQMCAKSGKAWRERIRKNRTRQRIMYDWNMQTSRNRKSNQPKHFHTQCVLYTVSQK